MKKIVYILTLIPILALSQSQDQNWVKSKTYKQATTSAITSPDVSVANVQVSYFDGLGRPIQQIAHQQSNTGKDIVTHIAYDNFGRQIEEYLPFPNKTPSLNYTDGATTLTELSTFYSSYNGGTTNPFSKKELEPSPLGRVFKQAAPGDAWAMGSGKEIKFDYQTNTTNDQVRLFYATATWNATLGLFNTSIHDNGYYQVDELYKTITKDENWTSGKNNTTEEYKNKEGQVVLKRAYNNGDPHETYYIYDQFGNLTYVAPPLSEPSQSITWSDIDGLYYQYKYDYRNRLVEKKLPGKQWEFIIYDKLDRPVATGPAFTPYGGATIGWMVTEYDTFGRVTQTGWKQMPVSQNYRKSNQNSITAGVNTFALNANDILTKNYYDNYDFLTVPLPTQIEGQNTVATASKLKGLPTGSWVKVLDVNNPNASEVSYTVYDDRYRPIRSHTDNYLGGFTEVDSKLDWAGKTEYTITKHKYDTNGSTTTITDRFSYSAQDRLTLHKQQINSLPEQLISKNTYDELGQLISKNVGGEDVNATANGLQKVDYTYNIRGWLKAINDVDNIGTDLFAFKISYENPTDVTKALFNGNIAETYWKTSSDDKLRKYEYTYDGLNRLLDANYSKVGVVTALNDYKETLTYDKNGNIKTLNRFGTVNDPGYSPNIDNLVYTYDTNIKNQLVKVDDSSNSPQGFKDGTNTDNDFFYDANGNMTKDNNKGIGSITYNHLNLPAIIDFGSKGKIEYIYNAIGTKLEKRVTSTPEATWTNPFPTPVTNKTTYLAGFQYKDNQLEFFPHAEGYVKYQYSENSYSYVFNYTDHLGNIRVSYSDIDKNGILGNERNIGNCRIETDRKGNPSTVAIFILQVRF
ncbi:DUF6443 domain-containing protein [Flavobacterium sp. N1861]|uniref:DUF6443 domain-containing protein n=1 Tax=Flavobacterium sp. N1861 TaxID=2986825 RepID=UPI002224F043|nr:DUF6443 domain-containing protein [Flavobacterium sp. N1861]